MSVLRHRWSRRRHQHKRDVNKTLPRIRVRLFTPTQKSQRPWSISYRTRSLCAVQRKTKYSYE